MFIPQTQYNKSMSKTISVFLRVSVVSILPCVMIALIATQSSAQNATLQHVLQQVEDGQRSSGLGGRRHLSRAV